MRINQFVAKAAGFSRRQADMLVEIGQVKINGQTAITGQSVSSVDKVTLNGVILEPKREILLMLNKPVGYVCSKSGQGSPTVYGLLPKKYRHLPSVGRLDKNTSGLLLFTNNGGLSQKLTHPKYLKLKTYEVKLDSALSFAHQSKLLRGVQLEDGISRFVELKPIKDYYSVSLAEGRNRQIRRTFKVLGYRVKYLHRVTFGPYKLGSLGMGAYKQID